MLALSRDLGLSYKAAFVNGMAWNAVNLAIAWMLLQRGGRNMLPSPLGEGLGVRVR